MVTSDLQRLWWDWLGTAERLLRSLHEQTAAVMLRDVERVERLQPELDRMVQMLRNIDAQALSEARRISETMGVKADFKSLAAQLESKEAEQIIALSNRVKASAQNVQAVIEKNRLLIENELAFVAGSLHMLAKATEESEGQFGQRTHAAVLVDQKV
jgi:hypothetical protein